MAKMDIANFQFVESSMTSEDGKMFMLHVKRPTGSDLMLGFRHAQISNILENAAMQSSPGKDQNGRTSISAFKTSSFEIGRGPAGEAVLTLTVGESGEIRFLLPSDMPGQLSQALQKLAN
jgi:hypothetical protein